MRVLLLITLIFGIGCILSECSYGASISPDVQGFSTQGFLSRKDKYLECCLNSDSFYAQSCRIIDPNVDVKKSVIQDALTTSYREDCSDFKMNKLFRIMYLDRKYPTFSDSIKQKAKEVILGFKYWFTEFDPDNPRNTMIFWTENHQLQFHTAELLAGQLYKNEIFTQSGMTGREHIEHASTLLNKWLDQRGKMGFAEWHSNIYFDENIAALVNLVDFAENEEIATKAAMILDLMAFDFANNYYKGVYATTHGRTEDENLIRREGTEGCHHLDDMGEAAWILLGL